MSAAVGDGVHCGIQCTGKALKRPLCAKTNQGVQIFTTFGIVPASAAQGNLDGIAFAFPVHLSDDPADDKWQNQTRSNDDALLLQVLWPGFSDHLLPYIGEMHEAS